MLFAAETTATALITGICAVIVGVFGAWMALRGTSRSTTATLVGEASDTYNELVTHLQLEVSVLKADRDEGWDLARKWRAEFEACRDQLEKCQKEVYGDDPGRWRYRPRPPAQ